MRGDAEIGFFLHIAGTDLHLDPVIAGTDHGRVNGTVTVGLGRRDIILEATRHSWIVAVHDAERAVTLLDIFDDDAKRHDVRELFERDVLALHLAPD